MAVGKARRRPGKPMGAYTIPGGSIQMNISISRFLKDEMAKYPEVTWSRIAAAAFTEECERQKKLSAE